MTDEARLLNNASLKRHYRPALTQTGLELIDKITALIIDIDKAIEENIQDSREKSLALTKLEECRMWANKAISLQNVLK